MPGETGPPSALAFLTLPVVDPCLIWWTEVLSVPYPARCGPVSYLVDRSLICPLPCPLWTRVLSGGPKSYLSLTLPVVDPCLIWWTEVLSVPFATRGVVDPCLIWWTEVLSVPYPARGGPVSYLSLTQPVVDPCLICPLPCPCWTGAWRNRSTFCLGIPYPARGGPVSYLFLTQPVVDPCLICTLP